MFGKKKKKKLEFEVEGAEFFTKGKKY